MSLFKKSGGGYLNGVNGVIAAQTWESKEWGEGDGAYTTLTAKLMVLPDGATEAVAQFLPAGFIYEDHSISKDEETVEGGEGLVVSENSEFATFVRSLINSGFDESKFDESGRNFQAMVGYRVTFAKELNKARQMAAGKKKLGKAKSATATEEDIMKAGRRQDKNDKTKFYNHDMLVVTAVLGEAEAAPAKGAKKGAKAAPVAAKSKAKAKEVEEENYTRADNVLIELLADAKGNVIPKGSISSLIVRKALAEDMETEERDSLRKLLSDDEYLKREAGWAYDADDKKQPITLAKKGKK